MTDVLVIGSGPAGLSAALYAKRANLSVQVVERIAYGMGQVSQSSHVDNYLGLPKENGFDLGMKFLSHVKGLDVPFVEDEAVFYDFHEESKIWNVTLSDGTVMESKTIIYAAGAVHRKLDIPGEKELSSCGVSYCATCDGAFFRGKTVAVIGGGDTALWDALYLCDIAKTVYVIHRREEFRGAAHTLKRLKERENVKFILNSIPISIEGEGCVEGMILRDVITGEEKNIILDGVFVAVGMVPVTDKVKHIVELDSYGYIKADETGVTSATGFFVAGDVRTKMLRQVVTAVSDGANAATSAESYIRNN